MLHHQPHQGPAPIQEEGITHSCACTIILHCHFSTLEFTCTFVLMPSCSKRHQTLPNFWRKCRKLRLLSRKRTLCLKMCPFEMRERERSPWWPNTLSTTATIQQMLRRCTEKEPCITWSYDYFAHFTLCSLVQWWAIHHSC